VRSVVGRRCARPSSYGQQPAAAAAAATARQAMSVTTAAACPSLFSTPPSRQRRPQERRPAAAGARTSADTQPGHATPEEAVRHVCSHALGGRAGSPQAAAPVYGTIPCARLASAPPQPAHPRRFETPPVPPWPPPFPHAATPAPPGARRPAEHHRPTRWQKRPRRPAVRPAAAAGRTAGWWGRRALTDGGGFVRGDRSTMRHQPCAVGAWGSTSRLPGVGRTRLGGGRGVLDQQDARVGSVLGRRRRDAQAGGGRHDCRVGRGRRRRDRDPLLTYPGSTYRP